MKMANMCDRTLADWTCRVQIYSDRDIVHYLTTSAPFQICSVIVIRVIFLTPAENFLDVIASLAPLAPPTPNKLIH